MADLNEFNHMMVNDYRHLKAGDPVKVLDETRDSGYLVYVVEDINGNVCKPLMSDVRSIGHIHQQIHAVTKQLDELTKMVDRCGNKLMDIKERR